MSSDAGQADRELMLAPLRVLGDVCVAYRQGLDPCIDATLALQLNAESPHLDFLGQTLKIIGRITEHSGVVLSADLVETLESVARHARAVMEAYELASTTG